jgi:membrane-bound ClpP family serine protease
MAFALKNMTGTPTDVSVNLLTQATFKLAQKTGGPTANSRSATYVYASTDASDSTYAVVSDSYDSKSDITRHSIRLVTNGVDASDAEDVALPYEVVIAFNTPGRFMRSTADILAMIGSAYSLCFATLSSKVPQPATLNTINLGLPGNIFG